jgi:hypothetical protein
MVFDAFAAAVVLTVAWCALRSPVLRALLRGRGVDPGRFGSWKDHLEDIGLGPSYWSDGSGGDRETRIRSKHTLPR